MCLVTRGREASGQEVRPDVGLPLMGPDGKWNEIGVLLFKLKKKKMTPEDFLGILERT